MLTPVAIEKTAGPPAGSILHADYHSRLMTDLTAICRQANVPEHMIHRGMTQYCGPQEIEWVKHYAQHKKDSAGVCFVGQFKRSIDTVMMAMCCAFLRNYVDARIVTLSQLMQGANDGGVPEPSIMFIPNFFVDIGGGKQLAGHQAAVVYDILLERLVNGQMTILYISSMEALTTQYGGQFRSFLSDHWSEIKEG